jgi:hypothetical protein
VLLSSLMVMLVLLGHDLAIMLAYRTQPWGQGPLTSILVWWLSISIPIAVFGWLLWRMRKVRLRHHLLAGLLLGSIPAVVALSEFVSVLDHRFGEDDIYIVPYPCTELVRNTINLPGGVAMMLTLSLAGVLFKWSAYGITREPTSAAWKVAGGIYLVAWLLFLAEPFHAVNPNIPSWTQSLASLCAQIFY